MFGSFVCWRFEIFCHTHICAKMSLRVVLIQGVLFDSLSPDFLVCWARLHVEQR